jgi:RNA polymerase sigma-70 factor (ECF subfamily)
MAAACYPLSYLEMLLKTIAAESVWAMAHGLDADPRDTSAAFSPGDLDEVKRTRDGDADAYRRLIERHQDHVARVLWRFSRNRRTHEELVQDVFVEAYLSLSNYAGKAPFEHWLARIATRVGYRYWKERARNRTSEPFDLHEWDEATGDGQVSHVPEPDHAAELLHRLLDQIPPRDRLVLTLRYLDQCDVAETARRTGWTRTMVKVQTLRARNKLRKLIEKSGMEFIR